MEASAILRLTPVDGGDMKTISEISHFFWNCLKKKMNGK